MDWPSTTIGLGPGKTRLEAPLFAGATDILITDRNRKATFHDVKQLPMGHGRRFGGGDRAPLLGDKRTSNAPQSGLPSFEYTTWHRNYNEPHPS
jgi:hypothetical protein